MVGPPLTLACGDGSYEVLDLQHRPASAACPPPSTSAASATPPNARVNTCQAPYSPPTLWTEVLVPGTNYSRCVVEAFAEEEFFDFVRRDRAGDDEALAQGASDVP